MTFPDLSILRLYWGHSYLQDWKWNCVRKHRRASKHGDDASLALSTTRCWQTLTKASLHGSLWVVWMLSRVLPEFCDEHRHGRVLYKSMNFLHCSYRIFLFPYCLVQSSPPGIMKLADTDPRHNDAEICTLFATAGQTQECDPVPRETGEMLYGLDACVLETMYRWIYVSVYVCHSMFACKSVGMHECMHP